MSSQKRRVLVVSHDSSRTGAPLFLANLLEQWKDHGDWDCEVWSVRSGELDERWPKVAKWAPHRKPLVRLNLLERLAARFKAIPGLGHALNSLYQTQLRRLAQKMMAQKYDLIYFNTIACGTALNVLKNHPAPKVAHGHELRSVAKQFPESFKNTLAQAQSFIAVGGSVARFLQEEGAPQDSIFVTPVGVQWPTVDEAQIQSCRQEVRKDEEYNETDCVVLAVGTHEERKGTDLFIQLAQEVRRRPSGENIHFLWVGGKTTDAYETELKALKGAPANLKFLEAQTDIWPLMAACDLLCSTSREDPFPLVCVEAAGLAKPIVCFQGAGSIAEFLTPQGGYSVPMEDIAAMAEAIITAANSPQLRQQKGAWAKDRVRRECDMRRVASNIQQAVENLVFETT